MKIPLALLLLSTIVICFGQNYHEAGVAFRPVDTNSWDTGYYKRYLPDGQTFQTSTNELQVRSLMDYHSPKKYIEVIRGFWENGERKMFAMGSQKSKNRYFIDYLDYPLDKNQKYLEWVFFRAQTNGAGGILVFTFAERRYFTNSLHELDSWDIEGFRRQMLVILTTNEFTIQ